MHALRVDICDGSENVAVYFTDDTLKAKLKKYVCCNIPGPGLDTKTFEDQIKGCTCAGRSCDTARDSDCCCIKQFGASYDLEGRILEQDTSLFAHQKAVMECNSLCSCSNSCKNRVVQNGLTYNLEVFKDHDKELCLRTLQPIPKHRFVCEYAGEVLTHTEARRRASSQTVNDMNYIFVLNEHCATGVETTYVDPCNKGNIGRFLNHSCEPNLFMVPVRVHNLVPKLCLFANRDIAAGEELTYHYGGGNDSSVERAADAGTRKTCKCKTKSCEGVLPFDVSALSNIDEN